MALASSQCLESLYLERTNGPAEPLFWHPGAAAAGADQDFWKDARTVLPEGKHPVTLPINRDVFEWFKSHGPRY